MTTHLTTSDNAKVIERAVQAQTEEVTLDGNLAIPRSAIGVVLFAHGSGSSRHSPRNVFVANELSGRGIVTLLIDLLTRREDGPCFSRCPNRTTARYVSRSFHSIIH